MQKALVILSGGQDSTTCLYHALEKHDEVYAVTFNYGQRHIRELDAARQIANIAGIGDKHEVITLGDILKGTSPLVNKGEVLEQYADHHSLPGGIEKTFVPMRNQLFLTIAANRAVVLGCQYMYTGVCEEDYGGYPDCRNVFIRSLENSINLSLGEAYTGLSVVTPLMNMTKAETVRMALKLPGCYKALAYSHTAYDGKFPPTGHDHANLLRAKGFEEAGIPDPLVLKAASMGLMELPITPNYADPLLISDCNDLIEGRTSKL